MDDASFLYLATNATNITALVALVFAALLLAKSLLDFSQTGPQIRREVFTHYRRYLIFSLGRLTLATFLLSFLLTLPGCVAYLMALVVFNVPYNPVAAALSAAVALLALTVLRFCRVLHTSPGVIVASSHYAMDRFYPLWERLTPFRLRLANLILWGGYWIWLCVGLVGLVRYGALNSAIGLAILHGATLAALWFLVRQREPGPVRSTDKRKGTNILMIGSDTLRADRVGFAGYRRRLTPNLDRLSERGAVLSQCYVPCARTAPSLLSMLTGSWPHSYGVRDNFVADGKTGLSRPTLPRLLSQAGYRTAALSDWAGADLGKFDLGFDILDVPDDQWNLKFLLRQGPKDMRLFLSLFVDNRLGKFFLEEIYYLAGVPLTRQIGLAARRMLHRLGSGDRPFFLNVFMASTHPPFASEYPYYTLFANKEYRGPSKFAMARLTDPFEIIRRQGEPREEFDLEQILDLYDGCVKSFDDEVGRILAYLEASGLAPNTLVVIYSDHGMEFFEHETWGQGNSAIGDYSGRVPMILSGACITDPCRLDCVTRSVDLAPTILDLVGLPEAIGNMDGVSLAAALRGGHEPDLPAFYETGIWLTDLPGMPEKHLRYPGLLDLLDVPDKRSGTLAIKPEFETTIIEAKDRMIRSGDWKLVYQPLEDGYLLSLYDIKNDPDCKRNVMDLHPDMGRSLWERLSRWMAVDRPAGRRATAGSEGSGLA